MQYLIFNSYCKEKFVVLFINQPRLTYAVGIRYTYVIKKIAVIFSYINICKIFPNYPVWTQDNISLYVHNLFLKSYRYVRYTYTPTLKVTITAYYINKETTKCNNSDSSLHGDFESLLHCWFYNSAMHASHATGINRNINNKYGSSDLSHPRALFSFGLQAYIFYNIFLKLKKIEVQASE